MSDWTTDDIADAMVVIGALVGVVAMLLGWPL